MWHLGSLSLIKPQKPIHMPRKGQGSGIGLSLVNIAAWKITPIAPNCVIWP